MAAKKKQTFQYTENDVHALKALAKGVASAGQQQLALRFFINASGIRDMPTYSDNPLEMAFENGRKYPGWLVAKLVELTGITTDLSKKDS